MNYIYGKQLLVNNILTNKYDECVNNITDITNSINYLNMDDDDKYVNVFMMMPDQHFKDVSYPKNIICIVNIWD